MSPWVLILSLLGTSCRVCAEGEPDPTVIMNVHCIWDETRGKWWLEQYLKMDHVGGPGRCDGCLASG